MKIKTIFGLSLLIFSFVEAKDYLVSFELPYLSNNTYEHGHTSIEILTQYSINNLPDSLMNRLTVELNKTLPCGWKNVLSLHRVDYYKIHADSNLGYLFWFKYALRDGEEYITYLEYNPQTNGFSHCKFICPSTTDTKMISMREAWDLVKNQIKGNVIPVRVKLAPRENTLNWIIEVMPRKHKYRRKKSFTTYKVDVYSSEITTAGW